MLLQTCENYYGLLFASIFGTLGLQGEIAHSNLSRWGQNQLRPAPGLDFYA